MDLPGILFWNQTFLIKTNHCAHDLIISYIFNSPMLVTSASRINKTSFKIQVQMKCTFMGMSEAYMSNLSEIGLHLRLIMRLKCIF